MDLLPQPWPWYVAGPIIGLCVPLLLVLGNRRFGISSNLRHICAAIAPASLEQFRYDWRREAWNLWFAAGTAAGGFIAWQVLGISDVQLSAATREALTALGVQQFAGLAPGDVFSWSSLATFKGFVSIVVGGFLVGFDEFETQAGQLSAPIRQCGGDHRGEETLEAAEPHGPVHLSVAARQPGLDGRQRLLDLLGRLGQRPAFRGQCGSLRGSGHQYPAGLAFQSGDLLGHRRRCQVQFIRRGEHTAGPGHGQQISQPPRVQIH